MPDLDLIKQEEQERGTGAGGVIAVIRSTGIRSANGIAVELDHRGIKTLRGGRWRGETVKAIIETKS